MLIALSVWSSLSGNYVACVIVIDMVVCSDGVFCVGVEFDSEVIWVLCFCRLMILCKTRCLKCFGER
jgi:hypothetical protein